MSSTAAPERILVVDDDRLVLATVTHGLSQAGYEVIDADNGDDAILLAREHRPVLALLDIRMDGMTGFDVAAILRDTYRIPFMFLSAFADEQTQQQVEALGALDYLVKPLDVEQIVPRVASVLARLAAGEVDATPTAAAAAVASPIGPVGQTVPKVAVAVTTIAAADPCADTVALAVGVLMHRHSLGRQAAWQQLQRLAAQQGVSADAQAERLLGAVEELARTAL
jgi:two-component system, response regulator PdtaR